MRTSRAGGATQPGQVDRLRPGNFVAVSPNLHDVHAVANALVDATSISVHVYGGNIGTVRRHVFNAADPSSREFVSGYSNAVLPNFWA